MQAGQRLFLSYLTLIAAVVASLTLATEFALRRHLIDVVAGSMGRELALATAIFDRRADLPTDSLADALGALTTHRVTIIARDGSVVGDSRLDGAELRGAENHGSRPEIRAALGGGVGRAMRTSGTAGARLLYLASATERGEVIRLAIPLREIDATLSRVRQAIFGVGVAALFIATLFLLAFSMAVT
ncbi:MAG: hypothetical protein M3483_05665, partial [Gemmatimonadota bacterium]|nr:hypothetical protein [Gemmatimonadota bacterium]MDQ3605956.1 hypothetical protein [Gemmatimonadota bacterium]